MKKITALMILFLSGIHLYSGSASGWKQINTDHFEIVFQESDRNEALEVAGFCEDVYGRVTDFFKSYPKNIKCIIHGEIDSANGYFSPAPPQINLFTSEPSIPLISALNGNWLRLLLTHELTHYVNLTMGKGPFHYLSKVFGKGISSVPSGFIPLWAVEGIAVKLETDLTEGGRGRNPFFEMKYKSEILEDSFYSWKKAAYPSSFPPYDRVYQAGYLMNDYLSRTYGNDIFISIYTSYVKNPLFGFNHAVKKSTGSSVKEIFRSMENELEEKYGRSSPAGGKLISPDSISDYYLPEETDRGWILYRRTMDREPAIVVYNRVTEEETILVNTPLTDFTSFTTDKTGNTVVFSAFTSEGKNPALNTLTSDLFLYSEETEKTAQLTVNKHLYHPALSADGEKLAAVQKNGQYSGLVEINTKTGDVSPLFSIEKTSVYNPSYSPDGSRIVFTMNINGKQDIFILKEKGECLNLTGGITGSKYFPRFDGKSSVIFSADTDGALALYRAVLKESGGTVEIKKICSDRIAAYSGFINKDKIIYGSYSHNGYCLKEQPLEKSKAAIQSSIKRTAIPAGNIIPVNSERPVESTYTDIPELIFWLPFPLSLDPFEGSMDLAPGIVSSFISPLGNTAVNISLSMLTDPVQPEGTLSFTRKGRRMIFDYSLREGYSKALSGFASLEILQNAGITVPIINRGIFNTNRYLFGYIGGLYDFKVMSSSDFRFPLPHEEPYSTVGKFYTYSGISAGIIRKGSIKDIFPPSELSFSQLFYLPMKKDDTDPLWKGSAVLGFPSVFRHHTVRISGRWGYEGDESLVMNPRVRGFGSTPDAEGVIIGAADYLFTLAVTDIPIAGGFSIQGFAGGMHIEKSAGFSISSPGFKWEEYVYPGLELNLTAGYLGVPLRGGLGISGKINPRHPEDFSFTENTGIYFYIGTDSTRSRIF